MCGSKLLSDAAPVTAPAGSVPSVAAPVSTPAPVATPPARIAEREPEPEPVINGPSFLGLNRPPAPQTRRGSLSIDPQAAPSSGNLDYLLEEEEPSGGTGKYVLIAVALLLAVGLGYLRWRNQGLPFLSSGSKKPAATQQEQSADAAQPSSSSAGAATSTTSAPASPSSITPDPAPSTSTPAAGPAPASSVPTPADTSSAAPPKADAKPVESAPAVAPSTAAPKENNAEDSDSEEDTPPSKPAPSESASKPALAKPPAAKPLDSVAEAQRYLYGKGVKQDCDRGLRLLKPAANNANPKAMIEMGALYSAGLCTPRDLPTAYRWFAMALRKEPDNESVQSDLQKLWGEMTQPERQLAIRLSQ